MVGEYGPSAQHTRSRLPAPNTILSGHTKCNNGRRHDSLYRTYSSEENFSLFQVIGLDSKYNEIYIVKNTIAESKIC